MNNNNNTNGENVLHEKSQGPCIGALALPTTCHMGLKSLFLALGTNFPTFKLEDEMI
jgi:hypothetical protein